ncbi:MAG: DUF418 domain-containing protein [Gammaproteobacteria bacterium]
MATIVPVSLTGIPAGPVGPGPVAARERIHALDVARGIAVLGVLLMNIWAFAGPQAYFDYPMAIADRAGAPVATWTLIHTLFEGSQRTLLSILFGAGALLVLTRLGKAGEPGTARKVWYRRTFALITFGLVNAYVFLWPADILFVYGLAGLFLYPLHRLGTPALLAVALIALSVPFALRTVEIGNLRALEAASAAAGQTRLQGGELDKGQQEAVAAWDRKLAKARPDPAGAELAEDVRVMQTGSLGQVALRQARVSIVLQTIVTLKWWLLDALAMMIIGLVLCRSGILTRPAPTSRYVAMVVLGFGIGLPLAAWQTSTLFATDFHPLQVEITKLSYDLRRLAMGIAYLGLILWFSQAGFGLRIRQRLAAVGRLALTNYLAQSILCALIFYGFGLGLYGRVTGYQLYGVVALIWVLEIAWSSWWLRRFQIGPFEWVWRSVTYGRRQAWRSPAAAAT